MTVTNVKSRRPQACFGRLMALAVLLFAIATSPAHAGASVTSGVADGAAAWAEAHLSGPGSLHAIKGDPVPDRAVLTSWAGYCLAFVVAAYQSQGVTPSPVVHTTAKGMYNAYNAAGLVVTSGVPPRGALVFYPNNKYAPGAGHIALSAGGGSVISARSFLGGGGGYIQRSSYGAIDGYAGWAFPANVPSTVSPKNKILTVEATGTSYFYDGSLLHWIPDIETYWCLRNTQQREVLDVTQAEANKFGNGKPWVQPCFDPARVANHVVRESGGTSYFVSTEGLWHWIPDGGTYNCLAHTYPVIESSWTQINSLRGANGQNEGPHAICVDTGSSDTPGVPLAGRGALGSGISASGQPTVSSAKAGGNAATTSAGDTLTCTAPAFAASGKYVLYYWWYRSVYDPAVGWSGTYVAAAPTGPTYTPSGDDLVVHTTDVSYSVALWCVVEADLANGSGWTYANSNDIPVMP